MEFSLLNDEPVTALDADLLGAGRAAHQLAKLLHDSRSATPFTLAVDAGWGMGKSSLMRLVEAELKQQYKDVETVWYNAWTSTGADALEGLIKSVLMRFDRRVLRRAMGRLSEQQTLLTAVRTTLTVAAAPFGVAALVDRFWRDLSVDATARNAMRDALLKLATEWADSAAHEPRRLLVVFIDDLDRCSEETVLAVCEAVKVYLDVPGLAFVIGCDRSALGQSGLLRDLGPAGSAFMEKLFQTSYRLPVAATWQADDYVRRCAERAGLSGLLDRELERLIADRCSRNPRRIKRLINGFGLECALNPVWVEFTWEAVIRTLLLQHLYGDFYRLLVSGDGTYAHAAREFLEYRVVRRVLRQLGEPDAESWRITVDCVTGHGLAAPESGDRESWGNVLARLEEELPTAFPSLARDQSFVHLIEEWMRLPQADELAEQLRGGGLLPVTPLWGSGTEYDRGLDWNPFIGIYILWVDDQTERNQELIEQLMASGAVVERVRRVMDALHVGRPVDVLVCYIARSEDREAEFDEVARLRALRLFDGPIVFFADRVTPIREQRCSEVDARIADNGETFFECLYAACAEIRQRQS